jgi:hypothetical protein
MVISEYACPKYSVDFMAAVTVESLRKILGG